MTVLSNLFLVLVGFAAGALATLVLLSEHERSGVEKPLVSNSPQELATLSEDGEAALDVSESQEEDVRDSRLQLDPANLPNTPPEYVGLLRPSTYTVTGEDLHWTFAREIRHEAWAFEVESEIAQKLANKNAASWAVVEHVECREMTCEIAGYHVGESEMHPADLVEDIDRSIWWHEEFRVSTTSSRSIDGMKKFLIIVTGHPSRPRFRSPMPLNLDQ